MPLQTQPPLTPAPAASQPKKLFDRTPSLNDLRALLARRPAGAAGPSALPTHAPSEPVAVPMPPPAPVPTHVVFTSTDAHDDPLPSECAPIDKRVVSASTEAKHGPSSSSSSEGARVDKHGVGGTPTPTTASTSESSASSSSARARRRLVTSVPFTAFISPMHARDEREKGKARAADPLISPTARRSRASMGGAGSLFLLGSQRPRERASRHARRASMSAAFEAYIVRNSPTQTRASASADVDTEVQDVKTLPQPPRQPQFSSSHVSPVVPDAVPVSDVGRDGGAEDADVMDIALENRQAKDVDERGVGSMRVDDDGMASGEPEGKPETQEAVEVDEADTLLELASVHLSQPEGVPERFVHDTEMGGEMDVVDEVRCAYMLCLLALLRGLVSWLII